MNSRRRQYVDHTVYCSRCGDVLIEIFAPMVPKQVVIGHRSLERDAETLSGRTPYRRPRRRASEWEHTTHVHMQDPTHGDFYTPSSVSSACRCAGMRDFDVDELVERAGRSSTQPPTRPGR